MPLNFPANPTLNQSYSYGNTTWTYNGSGWIVSAGVTPATTAGGDLTGTYPNPTIAASAVTPSQMATPFTGFATPVSRITPAQMATPFTGFATPVFGAWSNYTPVVTQSGSVAVAVNHARYTKIGKTVIALIYLIATGTGTTNNTIYFTAPTDMYNANLVVGTGFFYDSSIPKLYNVTAYSEDPPNRKISMITTDQVGNSIGQLPNIALTASDQIRVQLVYEEA